MASPGDIVSSDADLLRAHAAGDRHAFGELVRRHHLRLHRVARRSSLTAEDADDAVQDALLSAHRGAQSFRNDAAVGSWLHRIVLNACRDRLRRNAIRPTTVLSDGCQIAGPDGMARSDTAIVVHQALMKLPVGQRAAVVAVDMQGYTIAEAAALLGIPEGTVKSRCSRGRARLAGLLAGLSCAG